MKGIKRALIWTWGFLFALCLTNQEEPSKIAVAFVVVSLIAIAVIVVVYLIEHWNDEGD